MSCTRCQWHVVSFERFEPALERPRTAPKQRREKLVTLIAKLPRRETAWHSSPQNSPLDYFARCAIAPEVYRMAENKKVAEQTYSFREVSQPQFNSLFASRLN